MEFLPAKTIVTKNKHKGWFGTDYNMNIYRGCSHGCIYCDSRSQCYRVEQFDTVAAKQDAIALIDKNLSSKRSKGVVGTGSMSDPYNPQEKKYRLTRAALQLVQKYGFGIALATKSNLICRDIDILTAISAKMPAIAKITITTTDEALAKLVEPHAPTPAQRLDAIRQLAMHNIFAGVLLMPVLPFLEDSEENIYNVVQQAAKHGAKFVYAGLGVTLRDQQRDWYYQQLDMHFPGTKQKYMRAFGDRYQCSAQNAKKLWQVFTTTCQEYGLLYQMDAIISAYQKGYDGDKQLSFFT